MAKFKELQFTFCFIKIFVQKEQYDDAIKQIYDFAVQEEAMVLGFFDKVHYIVWRQPFFNYRQRSDRMKNFVGFLKTNFSNKISTIYGEAKGLHGDFGNHLIIEYWVWFEDFEKCFREICLSNPGEFLPYPVKSIKEP